MIQAWWRGDLAYVAGFFIYFVVAVGFILVLRRFQTLWAFVPTVSATREQPRPITLVQAVRGFLRIGSLQLLLAGIVSGAAIRIVIGGWSYFDLAIFVLTIAIWPFQEWFVHAYLLHMKPFSVFGHTIVPVFVTTHRTHHLHPSEPGSGVVPYYFVTFYLAFLPVVWHFSLPIPQALTGIVVSLVLLFTYEWIHYLIHTTYRPAGAWYHSLWRNHRLHHFRNENYWFGVTISLADTALRTNPRKEATANSDSCLNLGAENESEGWSDLAPFEPQGESR